MGRKLDTKPGGLNPSIEQLQARVGANARRARIKAGLTQIEVAELTGLTPQYVGKIENGQQNVTLATMKLVSDAIGINLIKLFKT